MNIKNIGFFLVFLFHINLAFAVSYCPDPFYIQKNFKKIYSRQYIDDHWKDNLGRIWEVDDAVNKTPEESETLSPLRFSEAFIETFPGLTEGTFISCNYFYSGLYKGGVSLTSFSFQLKDIPKGEEWKDGDCNVDPFDEEKFGSGNVLDCPFREKLKF